MHMEDTVKIGNTIYQVKVSCRTGYFVNDTRTWFSVLINGKWVEFLNNSYVNKSDVRRHVKAYLAKHNKEV